MPRITIELDKDFLPALKRRAKKNFLSITEMAEDIIRRSMISYKKRSSNGPKCDDKLVSIFSREKRGRKSKK